MSKRIKIGNIDIEKELSPFNGYTPFEFREVDEAQHELEFRLKHPLLDCDDVRQIVFVEWCGAVYFAVRGVERYGKIPAEVQAQGEEAILAHASERAEEALHKWRAWNDKCERFEQNPDVVVEAVEQGSYLRGRITRADHRYFTLRIEEPFVGEATGGGFNWASAMAGRFMFEVEYDGLDPSEVRLSREALDDAKRLLISEYRRHRYAEAHKGSVALVGRLNRKGE